MMAFILECFGGLKVLLVLPARPPLDFFMGCPETMQITGVDPDFKGEHLGIEHEFVQTVPIPTTWGMSYVF